MCRLLGVYGHHPSWREIGLAFQEQAQVGMVPPEALSPGHKDGWGIAISNVTGNKKWKITRDTGSAYKAAKYANALESQESAPNIFLCHLRKASPEIAITLNNTHPFCYEEWVFIHNGTVKKANQLLYNQKIPLTSDNSDSEYLFRHLLYEIYNNQVSAAFQSLIHALSSLTVQFSAINFLMSNGNELYVLRWAKKNLGYYSLFYQRDHSSVIFSSEPIRIKGLDVNSWIEIPNKTLIRVFRAEIGIELTLHSF